RVRQHLRGKWLRESLREVDADLVHGETDVLVDRRARLRPGRVSVNSVARARRGHRGTRLGATAAPQTDEQHLREVLRQPALSLRQGVEPLARETVRERRNERSHSPAGEVFRGLLYERTDLTPRVEVAELLEEAVHALVQVRADDRVEGRRRPSFHAGVIA